MVHAATEEWEVVMFEVLVVTHGRLGSEMIATAQMLYGDLGEGVSAIGFVPGESVDELYETICSAIERSRPSGGVLILCDILGGSPFLTAARAAHEATGCPVEVVCGLNLGMLLEVIAERDGLTPAQGSQVAIDAARQSIKGMGNGVESGGNA